MVEGQRERVKITRWMMIGAALLRENLVTMVAINFRTGGFVNSEGFGRVLLKLEKSMIIMFKHDK